MKMRLRAGDMLALTLAALVTVFFFRYAYGAGSGEARLCIQEEAGAFVYPIDADLDIDASGPLGITRILIRGGQAFVAHSPCRDKLCMSMGHVSQTGGWIACLPNRVFIKIDNSGMEKDVDAATY